MRGALVTGIALAAVVGAGCSVINGAAGLGAVGSPAAGSGSGQGSGRGSGGGSSAAAASGLRVAAYEPARVLLSQLTLADGDTVTVARFVGGIRFVLHCGPVDAGCPSVLPLQAGPSIGPAERPYLIAAFNGGFKQFSNAGGVLQEGYVLRPLETGRASLVIYRSGVAAIGVWGHGFPPGRSQVYSVRQNLGLLVQGGQPTRAAGIPGLWGGTVTGGAVVARSGLGQTASGQFIYVASMAATPIDLAEAMVASGIQIGMQLDINPEWVQLDYAQRAGAPLQVGLPGQARPANQYLLGWTRDFIAVLATSLPVPPPVGTQIVPGG